jgi:hypothetical protein
MQASCRPAGWRPTKAVVSAPTARASSSDENPPAEPGSAGVGLTPYPLRMRRAVLAALALTCLTLVAATGCGGTSSPQANVIAPGQVVQRFKTATGKELRHAAVPDEAWDQLGLGLNESKSEVERYGIFSVYVAKPGHLAAVGSLLRDKATKKPLARDARGVYWELDSNSGTWIAYKRYRTNVVLVWFSGSRTQSVDERWRRLDRVFAGLPS